MKVAAIDMGSNTTLMLICEVIDGHITQVYSDHSIVTRLGQGLDKTKELHEEALQRMENCLGLYRDIMNEFGVDKVVAVATSAARDAKNQQALFEITDRHHIPVKIIPGDLEARITFSGSTFDIEDKQNICVIDVGGGSTEVIAQMKEEIFGHSLDVGSVRLTERFISQHPVSTAELNALQKLLRKEFELYKAKLPNADEVKSAVAVAGTPTTLAMLMLESEFQEDQIHKKIISKNDIMKWIEKLAAMSVEERQNLKGMNPKRADVIVAGLCILNQCLEFLNLTELAVSTKGVRYGLALNHESI